MKADTLTPAQRKLLGELCISGRVTTNPSYAPARNLVAGGYALWKSGRFTDWLEPTGLGRAKYEDLTHKATPCK